jgi:hypothetical protein
MNKCIATTLTRATAQKKLMYQSNHKHLGYSNPHHQDEKGPASAVSNKEEGSKLDKLRDAREDLYLRKNQQEQ